jgi:LuxR family transcriptional regulator, maltose regulon positive regulatory protein
LLDKSKVAFPSRIPLVPPPLLTTKLYIPQTQPNLVPRPRLIEKFDKSIDQKLTLISAPAGFGKTTLVTEWIGHLRPHSSAENQLDTKITWLSLDEDDNDPTRFLTYFIAALQQAAGIRADFADSLMGMLQLPQTPPIKDIVTAIVNEGAGLTGKLVIVIDDYHLIESPLINEALDFLIEYLPPQLHLVIITRDDPHLPLAGLRAKGQMTELRAADLRFTPLEITTFLQQKLGAQLSPEEIAGVDSHTEGWITGLHLVAISLQGQENVRRAIQDFSGSHRFVLDYLLEEVLNQQPKEIQEFLLQTAVLNRLTGPLSDAVRGGMTSGDTRSGQEILAELEHANLFIIPLDNNRQWYRFHHLFSDLLRQRLHQIHLDQEPTLHCRASAWYEENGFIDEAIEHAISAKNFKRTTDLVSIHFESILKRGEYTKVWRWFDEIPAELLHTKPDLSILNAWYLFTRGDLDAAELNLQTAENQGRPDRHLEDDLDTVEKAKLRGRIAGVRAFIASYRGDIPGIIQNARQALDELPAQDAAWRSMIAVALGDAYGMAGEIDAAYKARIAAFETSKAGGNIYLILLTSMKLAITFRMMGQLQRVIDICQEQLLLVDRKGLSQMVVVGWLLAIWAEALAETNELAEALEKARMGVAITERGEDIAMNGWSQLCLVRVLFIHGNFDEAENIIRRVEEICYEHHMPPFVTGLVFAWKARLFVARNKLAAANQWIAARKLTIMGQITQLNESQYLVLARILLAQGQTVETQSLLQRLLELAEAGGRNSRIIEILILQALTFQSEGHTEQALVILERALELAESGGFVRIFVDEGPKMANLLYKAADHKIAAAYIQHILAAFPIPEPTQTVDQKLRESTSEMVKQLSERELEVLHLIATGVSRQEIAARLILSLNTVKTHVRNIYRKLGVNNQMQAVGKARALGFLEND